MKATLKVSEDTRVRVTQDVSELSRKLREAERKLKACEEQKERFRADAGIVDEMRTRCEKIKGDVAAKEKEVKQLKSEQSKHEKEVMDLNRRVIAALVEKYGARGEAAVAKARALAAACGAAV